MYLGASSMPQWYRHAQARRQDVAAGGAKNQKEGPKTRRGATFLKYSIGCMKKPVGQT